MIYENEDYTYNPKTGVLKHNRNKPHGVLKGDPVDNLPDEYGALRATWKGRNIMQHRIIWEMVHGEEPEGLIVHRDRIRSNNKLRNLMEITRIECAHRLTCGIGNTTGVIGVYLTEYGMWEARITSNYKKHYLGHFLDFQDAVSARKKAEKKYKFKVYGKCKHYGRHK